MVKSECGNGISILMMNNKYGFFCEQIIHMLTFGPQIINIIIRIRYLALIV